MYSVIYIIALLHKNVQKYFIIFTKLRYVINGPK